MIVDKPFRPGDNINVDYLIPNRIGVFCYVDRDKIQHVKEHGISSSDNVNPYFNNHEIFSNGVFCFFSRIPIYTEDDKFVDFNFRYAPVRVSLSKLKKSDKVVRYLGVNFPGKRIINLSDPIIKKLTQVEDRWTNVYKRSKDPLFRDVPQIVVHTEDGNIPFFACKIIEEVEVR